MGGTLVDGISALIKGIPERFLAPSAEDAARRQLPMNQEVGPHWSPNLLAP